MATLRNLGFSTNLTCADSASPSPHSVQSEDIPGVVDYGTVWPGWEIVSGDLEMRV
jgi:hypothetical protein